MRAPDVARDGSCEIGGVCRKWRPDGAKKCVCKNVAATAAASMSAVARNVLPPRVWNFTINKQRASILGPESDAVRLLWNI